MSMLLRYILAAFVMLGAAIVAISPFASTLRRAMVAPRCRASLQACFQFGAGRTGKSSCGRRNRANR